MAQCHSSFPGLEISFNICSGVLILRFIYQLMSCSQGSMGLTSHPSWFILVTTFWYE
jgi:hypothetical protein